MITHRHQTVATGARSRHAPDGAIVDPGSMVEVPTGGAAEVFPVAVALRAMPTAWAGGGTVAEAHSYHSSTGTFSLVRKEPEEHPPTRVEGAAVQPGLRRCSVGEKHTRLVGIRFGLRFAHHAGDIHPFVSDDISCAHHVERSLVRVVEAWSANLGV
ncbi:hypothetical protein GCM10012275_15510 [Longimycelium tulufanense]|uniref:Uncharacterized protein n=1 Tax=Longimycelium tulufanense TaxID=907463 RepID=A0A8J3CC09_9PSEU|nr:hypothetical protein GCM10012275_15510 [Longimycelium tulufanense]